MTHFLRMTQILIFTKSAATVCMMAICIYFRMLWRVIRWIANNCKVPLCHANELNPPKTFPLHFSPATKGSGSVIISLTQVWVLTRTRLEITLSCWLSSNNRLEELQKEGGAWNHCSSSINHGYLQGNTCHHHCFARKGLHSKDIAASKISPKSTIYRIIKNFKESGSIVVKKASGRPRKSSKCLGVKNGSKEATSLQEKHQGQIDILQKVQGLDCWGLG